MHKSWYPAPVTPLLSTLLLPLLLLLLLVAVAVVACPAAARCSCCGHWPLQQQLPQNGTATQVLTQAGRMKGNTPIDSTESWHSARLPPLVLVRACPA